MEGVLGFRIFLPVWYLKVAGPTRKIQSLSKLRQFRKLRAESPDTPLKLTGIGTAGGSAAGGRDAGAGGPDAGDGIGRAYRSSDRQLPWCQPRTCGPEDA